MVIIELIKELMFQHNKTIGWLAEKTGLDYSIVENVVLKDTAPTPEDAKVMLWALGVKLEDVLCLY